MSSAELASGGRQNVFGYVMRLIARIPFLVVGGRLYGAEELGRFAYATITVEFAAALALVGLKRGIALALARKKQPDTHVLADAMLLIVAVGTAIGAVLFLFPTLLFPTGLRFEWERFLALLVIVIAVLDLLLSGLAFHRRIDVQVMSRSLVEPWVLSIAAIGLHFTPLEPGGLLIAYVLALIAASVVAWIPAFRHFGLPEGWRPSLSRMSAMARENLPVAGADVIDWSSRRIDLFILGRFASAEVVGIYYVAQQIASLAGRLRTSFDPILAPLLSQALAGGRPKEAAAHLAQVGFWVITIQLCVVMMIGIGSEGTMGLFGPEFAAGGIVLLLLLLAELAASQASIAESALIYTRRHLNLLISLFALAVEAAVAILLVPVWGGAGAAAGLFAAMLVMAVFKQILIVKTLGTPVPMWRLSILACAAPAFLYGWATLVLLPEAAHMFATGFGVPVIFFFLLWRFAFTE
ncbi:MAG: oligosaccharide flippase family protein, partial [Sphingomonadaceae bacterium]